MTSDTGEEVEQQRVRLSLSVSKLQQLLAQGVLCINDLEDVQPETKHVLWQLCLQNCKAGACEQREEPANQQQVLDVRLVE